MKAGRPSNYTPELVKNAWHYANGGWHQIGDAVPTVAGLACELGMARETLHRWSKDEDKEEFRHILETIASTQERQLINGGLKNHFNAPISKMMLTKHGYSDRVENDHTSSDGTMASPTTIVLRGVKPDDASND